VTVGPPQQRRGDVRCQRDHLVTAGRDCGGALLGQGRAALLGNGLGLAFGFLTDRGALALEVGMHAFQHRLAFLGQRGAFRFQAAALGVGRLRARLGFAHGRIGQIPALLDHLTHRPVQEPPQQPDQNQEVDRLQDQCPPVKLHGQPAKGLAYSSRRATTRQ